MNCFAVRQPVPSATHGVIGDDPYGTRKNKLKRTRERDSFVLYLLLTFMVLIVVEQEYSMVNFVKKKKIKV